MKQIYFWLFAFMTILQSQAQVSNYAFAQSTGTFVPITGGTLLTSSANADSYASTLTNIGFNFLIEGVTYTQFSASSNGFVRFGTMASTTLTTPISTLNSGPAIAFFARDAKTSASGINYLLEGVAPNRVLTIEYLNYYPNWSTTTPAVNVQVKLYETTNVIQIVYGASITSTTSYTGQVGLVGTTTTNYNNRTTTTDWAATTAGTTNTASVTMSSSVMPSSGLTYTWTPPVPCTGIPTAGTVAPAIQNVCNGSTPAAIVVSGFSAGVSGLSFQWKESDDNGVTDAWENVVGGTGATTSSYIPPVFTGTPKYYRVDVTCTNSAETSTSTVALVSTISPPSSPASVLTFTNVTNTSFTVGWTNGNGNRRYVAVNSTNSFTDPVDGQVGPTVISTVYAGTGEQIVYDGTLSSVTVTGLTCNTTYFARVYEYNRCGTVAPFDYYFNVTPSASNPQGQITTQPATTTLPAINNFTGFTGANLSSVAPGWYEAVGAVSPTGTTSTWSNSSVFTGTTSARINLFSNTKNDWIISPKVTLNAPSRLRFKAAITDFFNGNPDTVGMQGTDDKVFVMISTDACGLNWVPLYTFEAANTTTLTNVLTNFEVLLDVYTNQTVQLAFKATEGTIDNTPDYDFHIANILIENIPNCEAPTNVVVSNLTTTSATVTWNASVSNPSAGYEYYYSDGTNTSAVMTTTGTSVNLSGLSASTTYSVWVRAMCGASDASSWTPATSFATLCNPSNLPYCEDFSTVIAPAVPICTSVLNVNADSGFWKTSTTAVTGFTAPYLFYNYNALNAANDWFFMNSVSLTAGVTYKLNFKYGNNGFTERLLVAYGTAATPAAMTNTIANITTAATISVNNGEYFFTPTSTDVYFLGFQAHSSANQFNLYLDDICLIVAPTDAVDWANIQSFVSGLTPAAVTSIQTCQTVRVFSQVYEPGVTEDDVVDSGLNVWIGRSTTNTDPSTWPSSAWTVATLNTGFDIGSDPNNNDEFYVDYTGLAVGTYYFASKYVLNNGPAKYGVTNGFWDGTSNNNATLSVVVVPTVTAVASNPSICQGQSVTLNASSDNPNYSYEWNNSAGTGASVSVTPSATTTYTVTATDSSTGCSRTANVLVTVNTLPTSFAVTPSSTSTCAGNVVTLTATGIESNNNGKIGSGTAANTTSTPFRGFWGSSKTQALYTAAELTALGMTAGSKISSIGYVVLSGTPLALNNFTIDAGFVTTSALVTNAFAAGATTNVFSSASYTPTTGAGNIDFTISTPLVWDGTSNLLVVTCYNNNNSGGTSSNSLSVESSTVPSSLNTYQSRDNIADNCTTVYATSAYLSTNRPNLRVVYSIENPVIWSPVTDLYTDVAATIAYVANSNATNVYVKPAGAGTVTYTATLTTGAGCSTSSPANVTANLATAPTANATHYICSTSNFTALSYVNVLASGTLVWYDAATGGNILPSNTVMIAGTTYYVANFENGCTSSRLAVTAVDDCALTIDENNFIKMYPNPTSNVLNFSTNSVIKTVEIFNNLGQKVKTDKMINGTIEVTNLPVGIYLIQFTFENGNTDKKQFIKI